MALPELDSSVGCTFGLEVDGIAINGISEVSGIKMGQSVIEMKQNTKDGKYVNKKLPGRPESGELTLTRGLTSDTSFEKWIEDSRFGKMSDARKSGEIIVYDFSGERLKAYKMTNAWPKSLEIGTLKAGDTNFLTEKLVVTYEEMKPA